MCLRGIMRIIDGFNTVYRSYLVNRWITVLFSLILCACGNGHIIEPSQILEGEAYKGSKNYRVFVDFPTNDRVVTRVPGAGTMIWNLDDGGNKRLSPDGIRYGKGSKTAYSRNGAYVAIWPRRQKHSLWHTQDGSASSLFAANYNPNKTPIKHVVFFPDERRIATTDGTTIRIWDLNESRLKHELTTEDRGRANRLTVTPDGTRLIASWYGQHPFFKEAYIWNADTGERLHTSWQNSTLIFSDDYSLLLSKNNDGDQYEPANAAIHDAKTGAFIKYWTISRPTSIISTIFSSDNKSIIHVLRESTKQKSSHIYLWDIETETNTGPFKYSSRSGGQQGRGKYFTSPDGTKLFAATADNKLKTWDISSGELIKTMKQTMKPTKSFQFTADESRLLTSAQYRSELSSSNHNYLWDVDDYKLLAKIPSKYECYNSSRHVCSTADGKSAIFSPDEKMIVSWSKGKSATIWDVETGRVLAKLKGHEGRIISAQFSPDGTRIVTGATNGDATLWNLERIN